MSHLLSTPMANAPGRCNLDFSIKLPTMSLLQLYFFSASTAKEAGLSLFFFLEKAGERSPLLYSILTNTSPIGNTLQWRYPSLDRMAQSKFYNLEVLDIPYKSHINGHHGMY